MEKILLILCWALLAATPVGASGPGGSGIDSAARGPGLRTPEDDQGKLRIPLGKPREESASSGASAAAQRPRGTDLGYEAEKEEEEFLKKQRTAPLKGRR